MFLVAAMHVTSASRNNTATSLVLRLIFQPLGHEALRLPSETVSSRLRTIRDFTSSPGRKVTPIQETTLSPDLFLHRLHFQKTNRSLHVKIGALVRALEGKDRPELRTQISPGAARNSRPRGVRRKNSSVIRQRVTAVERLLKTKLHPRVQPVEQSHRVERALVRPGAVCPDLLGLGEIGVHDLIQAVIEVELPARFVALGIGVKPTRERQAQLDETAVGADATLRRDHR